MLASAAIPLTFWLCALLAAPRTPLPGNEMAERVYNRLLGRQEMLRLLAIAATVACLSLWVILLPSRIDDDLHDIRLAHFACGQAPFGVGVPTCYTMAVGGVWQVTEQREGEGWTVVGAVPRLPAFIRSDDDHNGFKG